MEAAAPTAYASRPILGRGLKRCQVGAQRSGTLVALLGAGVDRALDDAGELRWHIGPRRLNSGPLAALLGTANLAHGPCLHRIRTGDEVIEEDAETVNVTPNRRLLPLQHLGCEIEGRSGEIGRCVVVEFSAGTEVHEHDAPVFGSHHVVPLDISMQQAGPMHRRHRAAELETDADSFGGADHLSLVEDLLEGVAANELHPQADLISNLLRAVDGDDIRMSYFGEQPPFVDD